MTTPDTAGDRTDAVDIDATDADALPTETDDVTEPSDSDAETAIDTPTDDDASGGSGRGARVAELESEGDVAADYLEGLLDIADLDGDIDMDVEGDRAMVSIVGADLRQLVGDEGQVLDALQELTRLAVLRETGERSRLMLDVGGYRDEKRKELTLLAQRACEDVRSSGEPVRLAPMNPFERKVVHDAVAEAGLTSESEGVEPGRYVVVLATA